MSRPQSPSPVRVPPVVLAVTALFLSATALSGESVRIEGPSVSRATARTIVRRLDEAGLSADLSCVAPRSGCRAVLSERPERAARLADRATRVVGRPFVVLGEASGSVPALPTPDVDLETPREADPDMVIKRLAKGGPVHFRFLRTLPDGRVVRHDLLRTHAGSRLRLTPVAGEGRHATFWLVDDRAFVEVDGQVRPADRVRTAEVIDRFGPGAVLTPLLRAPDGDGGNGRHTFTRRASDDRVGVDVSVPRRTELLQAGRTLEVVEVEILDVQPASASSLEAPPGT